jgi:hypothetical protein|tara:strand:- start:2576 stop:3052 length:477 start_codon:yes stop_codon:yes gene_type:complete
MVSRRADTFTTVNHGQNHDSQKATQTRTTIGLPILTQSQRAPQYQAPYRASSLTWISAPDFPLNKSSVSAITTRSNTSANNTPACRSVHTLISAEITRWLLSPWVDDLVREGTVLSAFGKVVGVDPPCSGIRMLWAGFVLANSHHIHHADVLASDDHF